MYPLHKPNLIFWDFDGVIKDSVNAKTCAFVKLFKSFGTDVSEQVREHHLANGGMSRFEKIPLYLEWADKIPTKSLVAEYCQQFSELTLQEVVQAPWVSGVEHILRSNPYQQEFVLVTATPQLDIEKILIDLNLQKVFLFVYGAPIKKYDAIKEVLSRQNENAKSTLMIGDALADLEAAKLNDVPFLLRSHSLNEKVFHAYTGDLIYNFQDI